MTFTKSKRGVMRETGGSEVSITPSMQPNSAGE